MTTFGLELVNSKFHCQDFKEVKMKLWFLKRIGHTHYDEYDSMVVRCKDELSAREFASHVAVGDQDTWLNPTKSTCEEIKSDGEEELICASFRAG